MTIAPVFVMENALKIGKKSKESVARWKRKIRGKRMRSSPPGSSVTSISMPDGSKEFCLPFSFYFEIHTARQDTKTQKHSLVTMKRRRKTTLVFRVNTKFAARYIT